MKKIMALALTGVALTPAVALATDRSIVLNASVSKYCKFNAVPTFSALNNLSVASNSIGASVLQITTPTTGTGLMNTAGFNFSVNATCNSPSQVTMTTLSGGVKHTSAESISSGTFLTRMDYTALATWSNAFLGILSTNGTANASSSTSVATAPNTGTLFIGVGFNVNTTAPLLAGDYSDTLRISLNPQ